MDRRCRMLAPKMTYRLARRTAFVEQVLPGLAGGVLSALTFYPLELYETAVQASCPAEASQPPPQVVLASKRARIIRESAQNDAMRPPQIGDEEQAKSFGECDSSSSDIRSLFRGVDMAAASAVFGFGAFFTTFAGLDSLFPCQEMLALLLKNTIAAGMCQLVNSPFQLLKTAAVVSGKSSQQAFSAITSEGKDFQRLWNGVEANLLCVSLIACKFTIFKTVTHEMFAGGATPIEAGITGGAACLAAGLLTYPCIALKTLVMAGESKDRNLEQNLGTTASVACGLLAAATLLYQRGRLYAGITPFLIRSVPPAALLFSVQRFFELSSL